MTKSLLKLITQCALLAAVCLTPLKATVIFSVQSVAAHPGDFNDELDLLITNSGAQPVMVGGFSFEIQVSSSDITLQQATTGTATATYILDSNSLFGPIISFSSPGQILDGSDNAAAAFSGTNIAPGATFGLGHIFFDVNPGAAIQTVSVSFISSNSSLSDDIGRDLTADLSFQSGGIDVTSQVAVPEPRTSFALAVALLSLGYRTARRRAMTRNPANKV